MKIIAERVGFKMLCNHAKNCDIHFLPKKDSFLWRKRVELLFSKEEFLEIAAKEERMQQILAKSA